MRDLTLRGGFNTSTVLLGTSLLGLAAGLVGAVAMLRRRSLTADAIGHATLPGLAGAFLIASAVGLDQRSLPVLLAGAAVAALASVAVIQWLARQPRTHEDAAIGIVLSVFFGVGVVLLSLVQNKAPKGSAGLKDFLFGQAATMLPGDVYTIGAIAGVCALGVLLFRREMAVVCFDRGFAHAGGWPVALMDAVIMVLIVLVTVAGLRNVGVVMVVALLVIPPVTARLWTERYHRMLMLSAALGACSGYIGSAISAAFEHAPTGAVIILTSGVLFLVSLTAAPKRGVLASAARSVFLRLRIAGDHVLEAAHDAGTSRLDRHGLMQIAADRRWNALFRNAVILSLQRRGLLKARTPEGWQLTPGGTGRGARVARTHELWAEYLVRRADIAGTHVGWSVDQVEHVLDAETIQRLETELGGHVHARAQA